MKFAIIGHLCSDIIHGQNGKETASYGGIFYSAAAMANIASGDDVIYPVFGVAEKDFDRVKEMMSLYPNVDTAGIYSFAGVTNEVHLFYSDKGTRTECSKHISAPIPFSRIEDFLSVHGILIDMISGSDITLDTLDQVRLAVRSKSTPIHLDLHSLTLGINSDATRFRRPLTDWRRWCFMVNSVQMNEEEAAGLSIEKYNEEALAKQMLPLMVNTMCITRGARGVTIFHQEHKHLLRKDIPGLASGASDPTGCGDVFGSAFLYQYCRTKDAGASGEFANGVAAVNSTLSGSSEIGELARFKVHDGVGGGGK